VSAEDGDTISDLEKGVDKIILIGASTGTVDADLTDLGTISGGKYNLDGSGKFDVVLTGQSSGDMSDSVQLGQKVTATYDISGLDATVVSGSLGDFIEVDNTDTKVATITLGDGADTLVYVNDGTGFANSGSITVTDFVLGTDKLVLEGTATAGKSVDLSDITPSSGTYKFDTDEFEVTLKNGGSALTADDLSGSVQLGSSGTAFTLDATGTAAAVTGGVFDDVIAIAGTAGATINFTEGGGSDTITGFITTQDTLSFDGLDDITATAGTAVSATDKKVADASSGAVYVFASHSNTTTGESILFDGKYDDADPDDDEVLADVAAFLEAGLTEANGEVYVALINDRAGVADKTYAYLVTGDDDGSIDADDIQLIGTITEGAGAAIVAADIG